MKSPYDAPTKEEGYRFLRIGEVITEEVEFFDVYEKSWNPVSNLSVGLPLDEESVGRFRKQK
jgi:hypothetical protein